MLYNYLVLYFRNLSKDRIRILNILSIALTLAFAMLILLFVEDELSYERWNENSGRIYRVATYEKWPAKQFFNATSTICTGPILKSEFPEIKSFVRFEKIRSPRVVIESSEFSEEKFFYADSTLFELFPYDLLAGSRQDALSKPNSMVISEDLATKYFDEKYPLGRTLLMNGETYTITGIINNKPNSHLQFNALVSFLPGQLDAIHSSIKIASYGGDLVYTYLLAREHTDLEQLQSKLPGFYDKYLDLPEGYDYKIEFEPLAEIHFSDRKLENDLPTMNIKYIHIFEALLVIILIFSIINYINLVVGKSIKTGKFIGLNKMYGISKGQIFSFFISDSLINAIIASIIGLVLLLLMLPGYNAYFSKDLTVNMLASKHILLNTVSLLMLVGVVPGVILALIFIPIKPLFILKNQLIKRNRSIRKVFVFLEISLLAIVVMGIIIVNFQLFNLKNKNLGFNKNNIVLIEIKSPELVKKASLFKNALKKYPDVLKVSASDISVGYDYWVATLKAEIGDEEKSFDIKSLVADEDFIDLYELELLEGRSFEIDKSTDISNCLINEAAVRKLGFGSDVMNRKIQFGGREPGKIIGVVKNFYFYSKHNEIEPLFIYLAEEGSYTSLISVKIAPGSIRRTLHDLNSEWESFSPDSDFTYTLIEDKIASFYSSEERLSTVLKWGTVLSFFIVSFGLICFVFFVIEQRIKEISIRKVNGASTLGIIKTILFKEFLVPGIAALILVLPLVHFSVNGFLQSMVTELSVKWWIYLLTIFIILLTLLLTTYYQLYKAANKNPVESLRNE